MSAMTKLCLAVTLRTQNIPALNVKNNKTILNTKLGLQSDKTETNQGSFSHVYKVYCC